MRWFENSWEGREITFPAYDGLPSTTWKLGLKLADERYNQWQASELTEPISPAGAWVVFLCTQVGTPGPEHVMKIHMQIPHGETESDEPRTRALQATHNLPDHARYELEGLQTLKEHSCRSAPTLVNYMQHSQDTNSWVPGGYLLYLLMTKCPGKPIEKFQEKYDAEREEIRHAFKTAWNVGDVE
ncbi:hypothetical protein B7463_g7605, partial [Scytalidium lignicola]